MRPAGVKEVPTRRGVRLDRKPVEVMRECVGVAARLVGVRRRHRGAATAPALGPLARELSHDRHLLDRRLRPA